MDSMNVLIDLKKNNISSAISLKVCKEIISNANVVMYYPKNFYLIQTIDDTIRRLLSSGILSHIINKYFDMQKWNVKTDTNGPQQLKFYDLKGAFGVLIILCLFSFVIFLAEILFSKLKHNFEC
jgi:hypothetical protein